MRVGIGFDIHRMVPGRKCVLGGVEMSHDRGPLAHSDGDVLLHALVDAMLGAAALGDIGELFPDTDPAYKDADSRIFVEKALQLVIENGYEIVSMDSVVLADTLKVGPERENICQNIADMLCLKRGSVSVKGKTLEGLGAVGKDEAVAAQVVVTLRPLS
jgi:2-C-methyl-D-erythritol 2,4-cyclodiphosphate synthase